MTQQTISNFYIPGNTKRIFAKLQEVGIDNDIGSDDEQGEHTNDAKIPYGVIDGLKNNPPYSELIKSLEISKLTNEEIRTMVKNNMNNIFEIHIPVCPKISEEEMKEYEEMEIDSNEHSTEVDVVFYLKRLRYSINSFAAKLYFKRKSM